MKGFLLGVLVSTLAFGGYLFWQHQSRQERCLEVAPPADPVSAKKQEPTNKKRRRGRGKSASTLTADGDLGVDVGAEDEGPPPVVLTADDLATKAMGDNLSGSNVVRMDLGEPTGNARELTQEEIDDIFRPHNGAIVACIDRARPAEDTIVPGRVVIKFRIHKDGAVRGVRVEAPNILQKGGLYQCARTVVSALRFPPSGSQQVVTYPFALR